MTRTAILRFLNPWSRKRERAQLRLDALRGRDGDRCRRCRRPIRFDLPPGHDQGARIEQITPVPAGAAQDIANLCLTHGRCNAIGTDHTGLVSERLRPAREAELFAKARDKRRAA